MQLLLRSVDWRSMVFRDAVSLIVLEHAVIRIGVTNEVYSIVVEHDEWREKGEKKEGIQRCVAMIGDA